MKHIRYLRNIVIIIIIIIVFVVECSRFLLCMLFGITFVLTPVCHGGVSLYPLSK